MYLLSTDSLSISSVDFRQRCTGAGVRFTHIQTFNNTSSVIDLCSSVKCILVCNSICLHLDANYIKRMAERSSWIRQRCEQIRQLFSAMKLIRRWESHSPPIPDKAPKTRRCVKGVEVDASFALSFAGVAMRGSCLVGIVMLVYSTVTVTFQCMLIIQVSGIIL